MDHRLRKYRGPETWAQVRQAYVAGESAPSLVRRFDVGYANLRRRARTEGWTRKDIAARLDLKPIRGGRSDAETGLAALVEAGETPTINAHAALAEAVRRAAWLLSGGQDGGGDRPAARRHGSGEVEVPGGLSERRLRRFNVGARGRVVMFYRHDHRLDVRRPIVRFVAGGLLRRHRGKRPKGQRRQCGSPRAKAGHGPGGRVRWRRSSQLLADEQPVLAASA